MLRHLGQGLLLGLGAAGLALLLAWGEGLQALEGATWRWRVAHFARGPQAETPIVVIALDQQSLDWGRRENGLSWPWPREAYAPLLDFCRRGGARSVALDLIVSEDSVYGVDDDRAFAAALLRTSATVGSMSLGAAAAPPPGWPVAAPTPVVLAKSYTPVADQQLLLPVAELTAAFTRLGAVGGNPDGDGLFRRVALLSGGSGGAHPSLALASLLAAEPDLPLRLRPAGLEVGQRLVPLDGEGLALLRYRGPSGTFPTWSAAAVIQSELRMEAGEAPRLDPDIVRDAHVFFGLSAPGLYDLRPIPIDGVFPGVEIHATALDNLLASDFLRPAPKLAPILFTLLLALLAAYTVLHCRNTWQTLLAFVVILPVPVAAGFVAYSQGIALSVALPLTATALALVGGVVLNYATEGRKKREIRRAFNQYLHPTVIEELVKNPERLRLGGEKREISIFFSDLQGFTTIAEKLDPEALTALLNDYLTAMTDIILDAGGTIDKYEGDAIIAFWNAPLTQPDHALRAVRAALACQERLAELRPAFRARVGHDLHMRIGINTGTAVVGNLGSARRFDYTMLGDAVNLAARLEGVNKEFATYTLISAATRAALADSIALREISRVAVVGRREAVQIFEPLLAGSHDEAGLELFARGLSCYYAGDFSAAAGNFAQCAAGDPTAALYAERCRGLAEAPPPEWTGVWQLQGK